MSERVQKILANQGVASRREIERLIKAGEVFINGEVCELGQRITGKENIVVSGKRIHLNASIKERVILYHKPCGVIVSKTDTKNRPTVFNALPNLSSGRWVSIGRLDINTSGLLLFTTSGSLANKLMHPSSCVEREYQVRVFGEVTNEILSNLQQGVQLKDGIAKFDVLEEQSGRGSNTWFRVILKEGRNREVRRLWESQGLHVSRLIRTRYGFMILPRNLKQGHYKELSPNQIKLLHRLVE